MVKDPRLLADTVASIFTGLGSTPTSVHEVTDEYMSPTYVAGMTRQPPASRQPPGPSPSLELRLPLLDERCRPFGEVLRSEQHRLGLLLERKRLLEGHRG